MGQVGGALGRAVFDYFLSLRQFENFKPQLKIIYLTGQTFTNSSGISTILLREYSLKTVELKLTLTHFWVSYQHFPELISTTSTYLHENTLCEVSKIFSEFPWFFLALLLKEKYSQSSWEELTMQKWRSSVAGNIRIFPTVPSFWVVCLWWAK